MILITKRKHYEKKVNYSRKRVELKIQREFLVGLKVILFSILSLLMQSEKGEREREKEEREEREEKQERNRIF